MSGSIADCNEKTTTININLSKRAAHTYVYRLVVSFFFHYGSFLVGTQSVTSATLGFVHHANTSGVGEFQPSVGFKYYVHYHQLASCQRTT